MYHLLHSSICFYTSWFDHVYRSAILAMPESAVLSYSYGTDCENRVYSCLRIPGGLERGEEYIHRLASTKASQGVEVKGSTRYSLAL